MSRQKTQISAASGVQFYDSVTDSSAPVVRLLSMLAVVTLIVAGSIWIAVNPQWVLRLGNWGYLGAFLIAFVSSATIILPAPGIALLVAMGTAFDPLLLGIVAAAGSALGELTGYVAGATGAALVPDNRRGHYERIHLLAGKYGAFVIFILATVPFPFFDLVGIIAGMMRMPVQVFLGVVFAGNSLKYTFIIWLGSGPLYLVLHYAYSSLFGL